MSSRSIGVMNDEFTVTVIACVDSSAACSRSRHRGRRRTLARDAPPPAGLIQPPGTIHGVGWPTARTGHGTRSCVASLESPRGRSVYRGLAYPLLGALKGLLPHRCTGGLSPDNAAKSGAGSSSLVRALNWRWAPLQAQPSATVHLRRSERRADGLSQPEASAVAQKSPLFTTRSPTRFQSLTAEVIICEFTALTFGCRHVPNLRADSPPLHQMHCK